MWVSKQKKSREPLSRAATILKDKSGCQGAHRQSPWPVGLSAMGLDRPIPPAGEQWGRGGLG